MAGAIVSIESFHKNGCEKCYIRNNFAVGIKNYKIMETPLIIWSVIVGFFLIVVIAHFIHAMFFSKRHYIQVGSEREEFFIPGDPLRDDENDYNDE